MTPARDDFGAALERLKADRVSGAAQLGRQALIMLLNAAQREEAPDAGALRLTLLDRAQAVASARPSMAPLANLSRQWRQAVEAAVSDDPERLRQVAVDAADRLIQTVDTATQRACVRAAAAIGPGRTVMTHSLSSAVERTLGLLHGSGVRVVVTESRPLDEGVVLATRLAGMGVPVTLVTDAQMALAVPDANVVLLGADSLLPDGGVVNKAGSRLLALAAAEAGVPVLVVAESWKRRPAGLGEPVLEEMDSAEFGYPIPDGVAARNVYFETVPARLIARLITEEDG